MAVYTGFTVVMKRNVICEFLFLKIHSSTMVEALDFRINGNCFCNDHLNNSERTTLARHIKCNDTIINSWPWDREEMC